MDSVTKNRQPVPTLRAMIDRAYGPEQVPDGDDFATELAYGYFNALYRIRLRDGARVVLKIAPAAGVPVLSHEHGLMRAEVAARDLVRKAFAQHADVLDDVTEPRVVEVDLWAKNSMIRDGRCSATPSWRRG